MGFEHHEGYLFLIVRDDEDSHLHALILSAIPPRERGHLAFMSNKLMEEGFESLMITNGIKNILLMYDPKLWHKVARKIKKAKYRQRVNNRYELAFIEKKVTPYGFYKMKGGEKSMKIYDWNAEKEGEEIVVSFHIQGVNKPDTWLMAFEAGKAAVESNNGKVFEWVFSLASFLYGLFKRSK